MNQNRHSTEAKVFISHSHMDRAAATNLQRVLEKYRAQVYLDQDRIEVGDVLPDRIRQGIEWCNTFLLIWSMNSARSNWVNKEWKMAYTLQRKIIPYCLDHASRPYPLDNFVYVDREDEKVSNALLLKAVFGRDFTPSSTELFPGDWRVKLDMFGLGSSTYELNLRPNGQITGSQKIDETGFFGQAMVGEGFGMLLNKKINIEGNWEYEESTQLLTLRMVAKGYSQSAAETIRIHITGRESGEINGVDEAGRSYVIQRTTSVSDMKAALIKQREIWAKFLNTDIQPTRLKEEIEKLIFELEQNSKTIRALTSHQAPGSTSGPQDSTSADQSLRSLYSGKTESQLAAGSVVAKAIATGFMKKIDERLDRMDTQ